MVKPGKLHEHCFSPGPPFPPVADEEQGNQNARKEQNDLRFLRNDGVAFAASFVAVARRLFWHD